jgi:hypothetical protein
MSADRPSDDWLAAALHAGADDRPQEDCPPPERLWDAVSGRLPIGDRMAVVDHVSTCAACAEAWRLAVDLAAAQRAGTEASGGVAHSPGRRRRLNWWTFAAAAALVAAVGAAWLLQPPPVVDPISRDPGTPVLESRLPEPASLPREEFRLQWTAGPSGSRYDVIVTTVDLTIIADARGLEVPEYRVPPDRLAGVGAGTRLLWRVEARVPDGRTISSRTLEASVR